MHNAILLSNFPIFRIVAGRLADSVTSFGAEKIPSARLHKVNTSFLCLARSIVLVPFTITLEVV